jgi:hypothetical protein
MQRGRKLAICSLALLLTGCGGGGLVVSAPSTQTTTSSPTPSSAAPSPSASPSPEDPCVKYPYGAECYAQQHGIDLDEESRKDDQAADFPEAASGFLLSFQVQEVPPVPGCTVHQVTSIDAYANACPGAQAKGFDAFIFLISIRNISDQQVRFRLSNVSIGLDHPDFPISRAFPPPRWGIRSGALLPMGAGIPPNGRLRGYVFFLAPKGAIPVRVSYYDRVQLQRLTVLLDQPDTAV